MAEDAITNQLNSLYATAQTQLQQEQYLEAIATSEQLLQTEPNFAPAYQLIGAAHTELQQPDQAQTAYTKAAQIYSDRGIALGQAGDLEQSLSNFQQAIAIQPDLAAAHTGMGITLARMGNLEQATSHLRKATEINPQAIVAHQNLATIATNQGKFEQAIRHYKTILELVPHATEIATSLAALQLKIGQYDAAIVNCKRALAFNPHQATAQFLLGNAYCLTGQPDLAIAPLTQALLQQPQNPYYRSLFAQTAGQVNTVEINSQLIQAIELCFNAEGIDHQDLWQVTLQVLGADPTIADLLTLAESSDYEIFQELFKAGVIATELDNLFHNQLLPAALPKCVNNNLAWEKLLTYVRRACLELIVTAAYTFTAEIEFLCALATQCFGNEYVFAITAIERELVSELAQAIDRSLAQLPANTQSTQLPNTLAAQLAVLAMYQPLDQLTHSEKLIDLDLPAPVQQLVQTQVIDLRTERSLKTTITSLTEIDPLSAELQAFYEAYPYPRWLSVHQTFPPFSEVMRSQFPWLQLPAFMQNPAQILVAGCGTGRQAILTSLQFPQAQILAVDLSKSSLSYALRKCQELGINNINFYQADLRRLDRSVLDQQFDIVGVTGVMHHIEGLVDRVWKNLTDLLKPQGMMQVGLYSDRARQTIRHTHEFIQQHGFPTSDDGIRQARQAMINDPNPEQFGSILWSTDFFSISGCRDLLFNPEEYFTPLKIKRSLEQLNLKFIGFVHKDPRLLQAYQDTYPQDTTATNLDLWEEFEIQHPFTFAGMYQFWCQKQG
jgi:tetratricopeptide (TPR) repeat protein